MKRSAGVAAVLALGLLLAPAVARRLLNVTPGLATQSFSNQNRAGTRAVGYLSVLRGGRVRFEIRSSVPAALQVDGSADLETQLERGAHFVLIELTHSGPSPGFELRWATGDGELSAVPAWRLTATRVQPWKTAVVRMLDLTRLAVVLAAAAWAAALAFRRWRVRLAAMIHAYPRTAALLLFVALAVVQTWPLASGLAHWSRHDNSDAMLNEWALGWVAHQIVCDPVHLFDANIFFPERRSLAYSEAMLVQGLLGAPLFWLGVPSLAVYNIILIAGFALTGFATALVAARWTNDWTAGILAGTVAAFNAHTLTRLPHLQAVHVEFLPLALAALDRVLRETAVRPALALAGWFVLQALASIYLMVFSVFAMAAGALARPRDWFGARFRRVAPYLALAAAVSLVALSPYLLPYWQVSREQGAVRLLGDVELYAASWSDYLSSPSRMHFNAWSRRWFTGAALFPGFVAVALALLAIGRGVAWKDDRARMCLAFGLCGAVLSFGTKVPGYGWLYDVLPLLQAVRAVSRFGYLAILAVALLAAYGVVELRRWIPDRRWPTIAGALLVFAALEPLVAPIRFTPSSGIPAIYDVVRNDPAAVVAELPMPGGFGWFGNARYVLNSTRHWRPMINGYSGFAPASFHRHFELLKRFPAAEGVAALRTIGVTHVFVHTAGYNPAQRAQIDSAAELERIAADGSIVLLRVRDGRR